MRSLPTSAAGSLGGQFEAGLKLPVTYHVVFAFDRDAKGDLMPGQLGRS